MNETVTQLGADKRLVAILTPSTTLPAKPIACLLVNAGVVHRIGPHRLNVKLARLLAQQGISSLRLDLSGLGDSAPVSGRANFREDQPVGDLQSAMDFFEKEKGIDRFVVVGICSGAVNGYALALADPRVIGLLMFDGFTFPTRKTDVLRRWKRFRALSWSELFVKLSGKLTSAFTGTKKTAQNSDGINPIPRQDFANGMNALTARGVNVYVFYSGSFVEQYNYDNQLHDAFPGEPFLKHIRCDYRPQIDHTITPIAAQEELIRETSSWCGQLAATFEHEKRSTARTQDRPA